MSIRHLAAAATSLCVAVSSGSAVAATNVIDFEGLSSMTYWQGNPVPSAAQLSNYFLSTLGVSFSSGNNYVAVVALGTNHATSGVNGIGATDGNGFLTYYKPHSIVAEFFDPQNPSVMGVTDFVSLRGDLWGNGLTITLNAFDVSGKLIDTFSTLDTGGEVLRVSAPGIHSVEFLGTDSGNGGVGVDDFTFNTVQAFAVPEPATLALVGAALLGVGATRKRKPTTIEPRQT